MTLLFVFPARSAAIVDWPAFAGLSGVRHMCRTGGPAGARGVPRAGVSRETPWTGGEHAGARSRMTPDCERAQLAQSLRPAGKLAGGLD